MAGRRFSLEDIYGGGGGASEAATSRRRYSVEDIYGSRTAPAAPAERPVPSTLPLGAAVAGRPELAEPRRPEPARTPTPDRSSARGDIEAGFRTLARVPGAISLSRNVNDLLRAPDELSRLQTLRQKTEEQVRALGLPVEEAAAELARRTAVIDRKIEELGGEVQQSRAEIGGQVADQITRQAEVNVIPQNPAAERVGQAEDFGSGVAAFAEDPLGVTRTFVLRSLPASIPGIAGGIGGFALGGPLGAAAGAGAGEAGTEYSLALADAVIEELAANEIDVNDPRAVADFVEQNPDAFQGIVDDALVRAGIIGAAGALGGAASGRIAQAAAPRGLGVRSTAAVAGGAVETGTEMLGEAGAQLATEGEIHAGEVLAEGIGGAGQGAVTTAGQIAVEGLNERRARRAERFRGERHLTEADERSPLPNDVLGEGYDDLEKIVGKGRSGEELDEIRRARQIEEHARTRTPEGSVPLSTLYGEGEREEEAPTAAPPPEPAPPVTPSAPESVTPPAPVTPEPGPTPLEQTEPTPRPADVARDQRDVEILDNEAVRKIETDPKTFQYKANTDEEGVSERLRGVEKWDDRRAGVAIVYEYKDGRRVIVDGHQRLKLAKRAADGGQRVNLITHVLREADGITEADARAIGAEKNIAEGSGTALDAAKVLRDTRKTAADLNLPRTSQLVRDGEALSRLSEDAFDMVTNEVATERDGAIVGRIVQDPERHRDVLGLVARLKPSNATQAEAIVRQAAETEVRETQETLFGEEEVANNLYLERAKVLDRAIKDLGRDISTFRTLTDRGETITEAGNVLSQEANTARLDADARARATLMKQANTKGPISDALTEAARSLKEGGKVTDAAREFVGAVRAAEGMAGTGGTPAGGPRPGGQAADGARPAAPAGQAPQVEQTPEGTQTVVPGVAPITPGDRTNAAIQSGQNRPLSGGNAPPPGGRDSLFGDPGEFNDLFTPPAGAPDAANPPATPNPALAPAPPATKPAEGGRADLDDRTAFSRALKGGELPDGASFESVDTLGVGEHPAFPDTQVFRVRIRTEPGSTRDGRGAQHEGVATTRVQALRDAVRAWERFNGRPAPDAAPAPRPGAQGHPFKLADRLDAKNQKALATYRDTDVGELVGELDAIARRAEAALRAEGLDSRDFDARGQDREGNWNQSASIIGEAEAHANRLLDQARQRKSGDLEPVERDEDSGELAPTDDPTPEWDALMFLETVEGMGLPVNEAVTGRPDPDRARDIASLERMPEAEIFPDPGKTVNIDTNALKAGRIPQEEADGIVQGWKGTAAEIGARGENANKVIISLFDYTGTWAQPWRDAGYKVLQHDIKAGSDVLVDQWVYDQIEEARAEGFEIVGVLAATPCTTYAASGARWWEGRHDVESEEALVTVFGRRALGVGAKSPLEYNNMLVQATRDVIAVANPTRFHVLENPVGRIAEKTNLPQPTARFHPNNFGDPYTKRTQLWGTMETDLPLANVKPVEGSKMQSQVRGTDPLGKEQRSTTPEGFAYAFFMANDPVARESQSAVRTPKPAPTADSRPAREPETSDAAEIAAFLEAPRTYELQSGVKSPYTDRIDAWIEANPDRVTTRQMAKRRFDITADTGYGDEKAKITFVRDSETGRYRFLGAGGGREYVGTDDTKADFDAAAKHILRSGRKPEKPARPEKVSTRAADPDFRPGGKDREEALRLYEQDPIGYIAGRFLLDLRRDGPKTRDRLASNHQIPGEGNPPIHSRPEIADAAIGRLEARRLIIKRGQTYRAVTDDRKEAAEPKTPAPKAADRWTRIGENAKGQPLYEDENGVRSYTEDGVRITESVTVPPTGAVYVSPADRGRDYLTSDEWEQHQADARVQAEFDAADARRKAERDAAEKPSLDVFDKAGFEVKGDTATARITRPGRTKDGESVQTTYTYTVNRRWNDSQKKWMLHVRRSTNFHGAVTNPPDKSLGTHTGTVEAYAAAVEDGFEPENGNDVDVVAKPAAKRPRAPRFEGPRKDNTSALTIEEQDRLAALRDQFRKKIKNQLNVGLDPELIAVAAEMASIYVKAGARRFRDLLRAMIEDLGLSFDEAQPYARQAYNQVRDDLDLAGEDVSDMDAAAAVLEQVRAMRSEIAGPVQMEGEPEPEPTDGQKGAGNYRKGHVRWNGLDLTVETAKGQERSGTSPDGRNWHVLMEADYGYVRRTEGADGDQVDFYLGDMRDSDLVVIVNQIDPATGEFDEHKVILGTGSSASAIGVYRSGFNDGRANERIGSYTTTSVANFKRWLAQADLTVPTEPITRPFHQQPPLSPVRDADVRGQLIDGFRKAFQNGERFETIVQARKRVEEFTGEPYQPENAKDLEEAIEIAVVLEARRLAGVGGANNPARTYNRLVDLYERQPILAERTSTSIERQAYSTPAPLAYLASRLAEVTRGAGVGKPHVRVYEPTAGNGMLLIEASPASVVAGELTDDRIDGLRRVLGDGAKIITGDAMEAKPGRYATLIANPPFGKVRDETGRARTWPLAGMTGETSDIDHAIVAKGLDGLEEGGRAVLIIGGQKGQDADARKSAYQSGEARKFFKRLYDNYNVTEHFTVDGRLYQRQGAGWPVDVIVIEGKGKSARPYPMKAAPVVYASWDALGERLDGRDSLDTRGVGEPPRSGAPRPADQAADDRPVSGGPRQPGKPDDTRRRPGAGGAPAADVRGPRGEPVRGGQSGGRRPAAGGGERVPGGTVGVDGGTVAGPAGADQARPAADERDLGGDRPGGLPGAAVSGGDVARAENTEVETNHQVRYAPRSRAGFMVGTLVPRNMQQAIDRALDGLEQRVGSIDKFVADELGYTLEEALGTPDAPGYFSAEQIDALAMAMENVGQGKGFIIGDQTGVGKGRFVAAMLRYAHRKGMVPVFVTKDPGLYGDMIRDLRDIGMADAHTRVMLTNNALRGKNAVPLSSEEGDVLTGYTPAQMKKALNALLTTGRLPENVDMLFTTYSQMQQHQGKDTPRMHALRAISPNAMFILDESHEAGGTGPKERTSKEDKDKLPRSEFVRSLLADSQGAVFSSATYAKNPAVMSLYAKTDLSMIETDMDKLGATIAKGGVPLQQVIANMLVEAGQYARRERSFDGVGMNLDPLVTNRDMAVRGAELIRGLFNLDVDVMEPLRQAFIAEKAEEGMAGGLDLSTGSAAMTSTTFSSTMHNVANQFLLAIKVNAVVDKAIEIHRGGEKPIIALSNTNAQVVKEAAEQAGAAAGAELAVPFNNILERYLNRLRRISLKDENDKITYLYMTDSDMVRLGGQEALDAYREAERFIRESDLAGLPGSPIDAILDRLEAAGIPSDEITGRTVTLRGNVLEARNASAANKKRAMADFNSGKVDALVINRSGSTGFSLHATAAKGNDGKKRHMLILQPEANIDLFMQMLGRIHRTGQIELPNYTIAVSDLAVENRLAAVLMKKMASLNANTTASKRSAVSLDHVVDFLNPYGDRVVTDYLRENPDLARMLALEVPPRGAWPDAAAKFTGKLVSLHPDMVERIYTDIESAYLDLIEALDRMGMNALEAKTLELDARTISTVEIVPSKDDFTPFGRAARVETVDVKRLGKPYSPEQLEREIEKVTGGNKKEFIRQSHDALGPRYKAGLDELAERRRAAEAKMAEAKTDKQKDAAKDALNRVETAEIQHRTRLDRITTFIDDLAPGRVGTISVGEGASRESFAAVSLGVDVSRLGASSLAPSAVTVRIAVADAGREVRVPLSKISGGEESEYRWDPLPDANRGAVIQAFVEGQSESRETRQIAAGNIPAAFAKLEKGQIVFYTDSDGALREGLLMPRNFNAGRALARAPVRFPEPAQVADFLEEGNYGRRLVTSEDKGLRVSHTGSEFVVLVSSKHKKYSLNKEVRGFLGEWGKRGSGGNFTKRMGRADLERMLAVFAENLGTEYTTEVDRDEARRITGETLPDFGEDELGIEEGDEPAGRGPRFALGRNDPRPETPGFRRWFGNSKAVDEAGRPVVVYHGTAAAFDQHDGLKGRKKTDAPLFAHFFTDNPDVAWSYAKGRGRNIRPSYLRLENPVIVDLGERGGQWAQFESPIAGTVMDQRYGQDRNVQVGDLIDMNTLAILASKNGHDGLIVRNVWDSGGRRKGADALQTTYAAFSPEQIRSALVLADRRTPAGIVPADATDSVTSRAGDAIVSYETTDLAQERARSTAEQMRKELDSLGLPSIAVRVVERLFGRLTSESHDAELDGMFFEGVVTVALQRGAAAARRVLRHEAVHAMRDPFLWSGNRPFGLFRRAEWQTLEAGARRDKDRLAKIRALYGDASEEIILEEVIADQFSAWEAGQFEARGFVRSAFERMRGFLEAVGNALRGNGFQTADAVFRRMHRGEIGARGTAPETAGRRGPMFSIDPDQQREQARTDRTVSRMVGEKVRHAVELKTPVTVRQESFLRTMMVQPIDVAMRIPFMAVGGINKRGQWRYGPKIREVTSHLAERQSFGFANPLVERVRAGMIDRYGLPKDYVERERRRGVDEQLILGEGREFLDAFMAQDMTADEAKVLQAVLTGERVGDAEMQRLAEPIRNAIDMLGQEAVELGLLSAESYERNRGKYLHRVYERHELDMTWAARRIERFFGGRRRKIIGEQFKGRGLFEEVPAEKIWRGNEEYLGAQRGVPQQGDKVIVLDLRSTTGTEPLEEGMRPKGRRRKRVYWPADRPIPERLANYESRGVFEVRGKKGGNLILWRDFTKAERLKMGEILDARYTLAKTYSMMARDLATGRFFSDIAKNENWSRTKPPAGSDVDEAPEEHGWRKRMWVDPDVEWVKVPMAKIPKSDTYRYGALAGRYVRADIWRDLEEMRAMHAPHFWQTVLTQWKINKTARSPVVHMNNVMSNFMLMDMADVRIPELVTALRAMATGDAIYREAQQAGAFGGDIVTQEFRDTILSPLLEDLRRDLGGGRRGIESEARLLGSKIGLTGTLGFLGKVTDRLATFAKKADATMVRTYQLEDQLFRMATYVRRRQQGYTVEEAAVEARDQFLNYDIRAPWINLARRTVLPFIAYTYRAVPKLAATIADRPWKIAKYFAIYQAMNAVAYSVAPSEWDEEEERNALRPREAGYLWTGSERLVRMPYLVDGNPVFLDVRRWVPAGDVFESGALGTGESFLPPWLHVGGPLPLAFEMYLNKSAFLGKEIYNPLIDTYAERAEKLAAYAWQSWMPSAFWVPGSWYQEQIFRAARGDAMEWGSDTPYSLSESIMSSVGIKLKPKDVLTGYRLWEMDFARVDQELSAHANMLARHAARRIITEAKYQREIARINEKRAALLAQRLERFAPLE